MRIVIIGGTGHIGGHLIPMLIRDGIDATVVTRGRGALPDNPEWAKVNVARIAYGDSNSAWKEDLKNTLREGDVLIDILGNDLAAAYDIARQRGCSHVIACGSVWMLGTPRRVPFNEISQTPFWGEGYAQRWQVITEMLRRSIAEPGPLFTAILPPNICGPGKIPLDTVGGRDINVHRHLIAGNPVILPEGPDVLIGPCDAEDIARAFHLAARQPHRAGGEIFNVGSAYALSASEFVATYSQIYGVTNPIQRIPWKEFAEKIIPDPGSRYHYEAHMCPDISKLRTHLGYEPHYTPEQTMRRAVQWMREKKLL
jgi:nucleoside-diphosphate-sugar epimerase